MHKIARYISYLILVITGIESSQYADIPYEFADGSTYRSKFLGNPNSNLFESMKSLYEQNNYAVDPQDDLSSIIEHEFCIKLDMIENTDSFILFELFCSKKSDLDPTKLNSRLFVQFYLAADYLQICGKTLHIFINNMVKNFMLSKLTEETFNCRPYKSSYGGINLAWMMFAEFLKQTRVFWKYFENTLELSKCWHFNNFSGIKGERVSKMICPLIDNLVVKYDVLPKETTSKNTSVDIIIGINRMKILAWFAWHLNVKSLIIQDESNITPKDFRDFNDHILCLNKIFPDDMQFPILAEVKIAKFATNSFLNNLKQSISDKLDSMSSKEKTPIKIQKLCFNNLKSLIPTIVFLSADIFEIEELDLELVSVNSNLATEFEKLPRIDHVSIRGRHISIDTICSLVSKNLKIESLDIKVDCLENVFRPTDSFLSPCTNFLQSAYSYTFSYNNITNPSLKENKIGNIKHICINPPIVCVKTLISLISSLPSDLETIIIDICEFNTNAASLLSRFENLKTLVIGEYQLNSNEISVLFEKISREIEKISVLAKILDLNSISNFKEFKNLEYLAIGGELQQKDVVDALFLNINEKIEVLILFALTLDSDTVSKVKRFPNILKLAIKGSIQADSIVFAIISNISSNIESLKLCGILSDINTVEYFGRLTQIRELKIVGCAIKAPIDSAFLSKIPNTIEKLHFSLFEFNKDDISQFLRLTNLKTLKIELYSKDDIEVLALDDIFSDMGTLEFFDREYISLIFRRS